jgi:hypothetical protein
MSSIWLKHFLVPSSLALACMLPASAAETDASIVVAQSDALERRLERSMERNRQRQEKRQQAWEKEQDERRRSANQKIFRDLQEAVAKGQSLGMALEPVGEKLRAQFNIPAHVKGASVAAIVPQSNAEKAGVQSGDIIFRIGNVNLQSFDDLKQQFQAIKNSRNSQIRMSVYNRNSRVSQELTVELPKGMIASPEDLVGAEAAALYAVAVPEFVSRNCPHLMPNWPRVSELLRQFQVQETAIKAHPKFNLQMVDWNKKVANGGATELCEEMIRATYAYPFGGQRITGVINRR